MENIKDDVFDKLVDVSKSIETLYKNMYELEISGKKSTKEFNDTFEILKIALEVENKIYEDLDTQKCINIGEYLCEKKLPKDFLELYDSIIYQDYSNRHIKRVLYLLRNKIFKENILNMMPMNFLNLFNTSNSLNTVTIVNSYIDLNNSFRTDKNKAFMYFLRKAIEDYIQFDKDFIKAKYNLSFLNIEIEKDMLDNSFELPNELVFTSKFIAELNSINLEVYEDIKNIFAYKEANKEILALINVEDKDYYDNKMIVSSLLRKCLIKTLFLYLNDEYLDSLYNEFEKSVYEIDIKNNSRINNISINFVEELFNREKYDKNNLKIKRLKN